MIAVPRWVLVLLGIALAGYSVVYGVSSLPDGVGATSGAVAVVLFCLAFGLTAALQRGRPLSPTVLVLDVAVSIAMPLLSTAWRSPADYVGGIWWLAATACLAALLLVRRAALAAWACLGALLTHTLLWAGPFGVLRFGVIAVVLLLGTVAAGARAVRLASEELERSSASEQRSLVWEAAQLAHHSERQVRLGQVGRVTGPMLRRIVALGGRLDAEDRFECRLLEQTVRDEVRGRRLLNDAVRGEVMRARRRGAIVQVLDDGGVDDVAPEAMAPVLDRVADAMASVGSDRIVLRTAAPSSPRAVTLVGVSIDPTAAALGLDDDAEHVDLWLELDRPS